MLVAVRWMAVLIGAGAGGLATAVVALALSAILAAAGVADAPLAGLVAGVVVGLGSAGFVAARLAPVFERFHGSIAGLGLAALVVVVSILGGSPAGVTEILTLGFLGIVIGGTGGILGRRRAAGDP